MWIRKGGAHPFRTDFKQRQASRSPSSLFGSGSDLLNGWFLSPKGASFRFVFLHRSLNLPDCGLCSRALATAGHVRLALLEVGCYSALSIETQVLSFVLLVFLCSVNMLMGSCVCYLGGYIWAPWCRFLAMKFLSRDPGTKASCFECWGSLLFQVVVCLSTYHIG